MQSKFGFLSKITFLQDLASIFIAKTNPSITHNLEKYQAIKKVMYLTAIEDVEGDYLEFGVFTGSSFCHSIRCYQALLYLNPLITKTHFYGFDSFSGFGKLDEIDKHPFFKNENFTTNFETVQKRIKKIAKDRFKFTLIPGFFEESLKVRPSSLGVNRSRVIFIDSDTYSSASQALKFCAPTIQEGTFFILDDFFAYHGRSDRGVTKAFNEFVIENKIEVRKVFDYGMGGAVFIASKIND